MVKVFKNHTNVFERFLKLGQSYQAGFHQFVAPCGDQFGIILLACPYIFFYGISYDISYSVFIKFCLEFQKDSQQILAMIENTQQNICFFLVVILRQFPSKIPVCHNLMIQIQSCCFLKRRYLLQNFDKNFVSAANKNY